MTISEAFVKARESAGLNQRQAAEKMGVTKACLSLIELGKVQPNYATLRKATAGLGVDPYLIVLGVA